MGGWRERLEDDPIPWLLDKGCPPIRLRALREIEGRAEDDRDIAAAREETYNYKPALTIAGLQSDDGTWFSSLVAFEPMNLPRRRGPGTIHQTLALLEYGWGKDHPIIWRTCELLQGLMWEDPGMDIYELTGYCGGDPAVETWLRSELSRIALSLLCRAGLSGDAGVKRKSAEYLDRVDKFYRGDVAAKLYLGETTRLVENDRTPTEQTCTLLDPDAPRPGHVMLRILGFNEGLGTSARARKVLARVADFIFAHPSRPNEVVEVGGKIFDVEPELTIRDLDREDYVREKLVGRLLHDLELLARCGMIERSKKAAGLLEWLLELQDAGGVVRADDYVEKTGSPVDYPYFPLEDNWRGKHKKFTDVTFRVLLTLTLLDAAPRT